MTPPTENPMERHMDNGMGTRIIHLAKIIQYKRCNSMKLGGFNIGGPQYRPQNTLILIMGTPK